MRRGGVIQEIRPGMFRADTSGCEFPAVEEFVSLQQTVLHQVKDALFQAQRTMEEFENRGRQEVSMSVGDKVFSNTNLSKIHFKRSEEKFHERFCGPFRISEEVSKYTYRLELPKSMSRLHPVFHVSLLHQAVENPPDFEHRLELPGGKDTRVPDNDMIDEEGRPCYLIENILDRRTVGNRREYLIKWQGYDACENSYISRKDVASSGALQILKDYDTYLLSQTESKEGVEERALL